MQHHSTGDPVSSVTSPTADPGAYDNFKGISWLLLSVVAASVMTVAVRWMSFELDPRMIVLLRFGLTSMLLLTAVLAVSKLRSSLSFSQPGRHILRGGLMGVSAHLGFYAIANMELVTVTVLFFTVPIFATVISGFVYGEHAGPRRIAAIAISFVGVLMVLKPGYQPLNLAMFAAILSSILFAVSLVMSRNLAQSDGSFSVLVSSVLVTTGISVPIAMPVWELPGTAAVWGVVAVLVLTGLLRLFGDIQAYRHGEASVLAPITYLRLLLIGSGAYILFDEVPDGPAIIGGMIIAGAAIYIAHREALARQ